MLLMIYSLEVCGFVVLNINLIRLTLSIFYLKNRHAVVLFIYLQCALSH